jgi:hypothetical protein
VLVAASACAEGDAANSGDDVRPNLGQGDFALATTVFGDNDTQTSYVALSDDPAKQGELSTQNALEVGGSASLFAVRGKNMFGVGSSDSPTVTRYKVDDDGFLEVTGLMSLGNTGISSGFLRSELVPIISDTKAYWISEPVVVWNPTDMTVDATIPMPESEREGFVFEVGEAVLRDDLVYVAASYRTIDDDFEGGEAVVLILDTERDEFTKILTDKRCPNTSHIFEDEAGDLYVSSGVIAATFHYQQMAGYPAPCMLRIRAGEQSFDADFKIDFADITEGRDAGHLVQGLAGRAYVLALHSDLLDSNIDSKTDIWAPYEANAWRWWSFELGKSEPGMLVENVAPASAAARVLKAGGRDYVALVDLEENSTTLLAPSENGELKPGLRTTGVPYGLIKLK